ncbi:MAG TPA: glycosyltransferase [Acetobacteraceae bacterium]
MRIALVDPSLFTLPYDAALAAGLQAEGHEVVLHGRRPGPDDGRPDGAPLMETFYRLTGATTVAGMPKTLRLALKGLDHIVSMAALVRQLARARPDVIHFQWLPLPLVDRRFLTRLRRIAPLVLTVHDTDPFNGDPAAGLQRRGMASSYAAFDRLITHTLQGRTRLLRHGIAEDRLTVLPHGLLGTPANGEARCEAATPEGPLTFLLFGKIKPYKGLDLLIEAFAQLPPALASRARLRVVGKPYMDLASIEVRIAQLGLGERIAIEPGFVRDEDVPLLFDAGTVVVFPYREIEASGVLSLAIAHGRPILASRLGAFAETVTDGVHGLLVEPGDIAALAEAMSRFLGDRAFAAACARAVGRLSDSVPDWQEIARLTVAVYRAAGARDRAASAPATAATECVRRPSPILAVPAHGTGYGPRSGDETKSAANPAE